jgi:hypothetical protein
MTIDEFRTFANTDSLALRIALTEFARSRVLHFIRNRFGACFGAVVDDDSPTLIGAFDGAGTLTAAFGLRDSTSGFFCERYLGEPIEAALTRALCREVDRRQTVEVTHLCARTAGLLPQLVTRLPSALIRNGARYMICTATDRLANFFERRGLQPITLAEASSDALPADERSRWGRYYAQRPRVMAGDLYQIRQLVDERRSTGDA